MLKAQSSSILGPHEVFYTGNPTFDGASATMSGNGGTVPASQWVCCRDIAPVMSSTSRTEGHPYGRVQDFHFC